MLHSTGGKTENETAGSWWASKLTRVARNNHQVHRRLVTCRWQLKHLGGLACNIPHAVAKAEGCGGGGSGGGGSC